MHIFFQNNQYLGSYYFTRSADDPVVWGCATLTSSEMAPVLDNPLTLNYTLYLLYCESFKRQNKVYTVCVYYTYREINIMGLCSKQCQCVVLPRPMRSSAKGYSSVPGSMARAVARAMLSLTSRTMCSSTVLSNTPPPKQSTIPAQ